jgi:hypothetical protein
VLATENLVLRQQINVLQRTAPRRLSFNCLDRLIFVGLYRLFPDVRDALVIVKPDTVIRWHRSGFRALFLPFMTGDPFSRSGASYLCAYWGAFTTNTSRWHKWQGQVVRRVDLRSNS